MMMMMIIIMTVMMIDDYNPMMMMMMMMMMSDIRRNNPRFMYLSYYLRLIEMYVIHLHNFLHGVVVVVVVGSSGSR